MEENGYAKELEAARSEEVTDRLIGMRAWMERDARRATSGGMDIGRATSKVMTASENVGYSKTDCRLSLVTGFKEWSLLETPGGTTTLYLAYFSGREQGVTDCPVEPSAGAIDWGIWERREAAEKADADNLG